VVRFEIDAPQAGRATLDFGADRGVTIWLDDQAATLAGQTTTLDVAPGRHVVTVAVDVAAFPSEALRVRLDRSTGGVQLVSGK
jgi:hypothetical protein